MSTLTPDQERDFIERQVNREISRRHFMQWATKSGMAASAAVALSGGLLSACSSKKNQPTTTSGGTKGATDTVKIGVIAPYSSIGAFIGVIVKRSLNAALGEINRRGGIGGHKVELVTRDTGIDANLGIKAYNEMVGDPNIVGILWCGGLGYRETKPQFARDRIPIMAVFDDSYSDNTLFPKDPGQRSVFQFLIPDRLAIEVLLEYAKKDRGYRSAAFIGDSLIFQPKDFKPYFDDAVAKYGLENKGFQTYTLGNSDFGPQLQAMKRARPDTVLIWGLSGDTANFVIQIEQLGSAYVDSPTTKDPSKGWHPQIMGSPGGTGDHSWADLAKDSAKPGTLTAWHVGGLLYIPESKIRQWVEKYVKEEPTGGEESPADGLYTLLKGLEKAGSKDRAKMVDAIENLGRLQFAAAPFSFTKDRHLSKTRDDLILVTLEKKAGPTPTDPPYQLGNEWTKPGLMPFPAQPVQLVRPTLEANQNAQPDIMRSVLRDKLGTQCTRRGDKLTKECKIH